MTNNVLPQDRHQIGQRGETLAANFLQKQGYQILERNFRIKGGEIDIIAQEKNTLVFVEVKARQDDSFGQPEEAINPQKIATIVRTGEYYASCHPELPQELRLDVLAIDEENGQISFRLYRDIHKDL